MKELPKDWEIKKLGEIAEITMGQSPKSSSYNQAYKGFPFLQGKKEFGNVHPKAEKFTYSPIKIAKKGSILLSVRAPVGDVNIADIDYCIGRGLASIFSKYVDNNFLFFYLMYIKDSIDEFGSGSIFKSILKSQIANLQIVIPPLSEQKAIPEILQTIQEAREKTEAVIEATRNLKKSMMKHLFTYGVANFDFRFAKENNSIKNFNSKISNRKSQIKLKDTEIGPIPEHWQVVRLGEVAEKGLVKIQFGFPCGSWNDKMKGIVHLRPFNINDEGNICFDNLKYIENNRNLDNYLLKEGDIIFNNTNSEELVGKTAYWGIRNGDFVISNHMTIIRIVNKEKINSYFLAKYLHKRWQDGFYKTICRRHVNQSSISLSRLNTIPIPLPSLSEQQAIAEILQAIDEKIEKEEAKKKALENLFKSMLNNLMSGKLRVKIKEEKV